MLTNNLISIIVTDSAYSLKVNFSAAAYSFGSFSYAFRPPSTWNCVNSGYIDSNCDAQLETRCKADAYIPSTQETVAASLTGTFQLC